MKKLFALALLLLASVTLAACGGTDEDQESVDEATSALLLSGLSEVRGNLNLPTSGRNGTTITWESSDTGVISNTGQVTRPEFGQDNVVVTLTATVSLNDASATREFEAVVIAIQTEPMDPTDIADVHGLDVGTVITVRGIVTAKNMRDGFIQDATGGISVFRLSSDGRYAQFNVGDEIEITANRAAFSGLRQLGDVDTFTVISTGNDLPEPYMITDVTRTLLDGYQGQRVSVEGFYVSSLPESIGTGGYNVILEDLDGQTIVFRVESEGNLGAEKRDPINAFVQALEEGQFVDVIGVPLGWHDSTGPQLMIYDADQLVLSDTVLDDETRVGFAYDNLELGDTDFVISNLNLATTGAFGATISWTSTNTDVVALDGTVTRPATGDVEVTLNATITVGAETRTKVFEVTVRGDDFEPGTVADALATEVGEGVYFEGVVTGLYIDQNDNFRNFFVQDADGVGISVLSANNPDFAELEVGNKVVIYGQRAAYTSHGNSQPEVSNGVLMSNDEGNHDITVLDGGSVTEMLNSYADRVNQRWSLENVTFGNESFLYIYSDDSITVGDDEVTLTFDIRLTEPAPLTSGAYTFSYIEFTLERIHFGNYRMVNVHYVIAD